MTHPLFDLQPTHNPHRWYLPVEDRVTVGPPNNRFLFGGVGLAAAISAVERTTGRPAIWATAQYLSYANPPQTVDIDVIVPKAGKNITQARVVGHVADREIFTVNAAVGEREAEHSAQWVRLPDTPPPEDCEPMPRFNADGTDLHAQIDMRVAKGRYGPNRNNGGMSEDGHTVLWGRAKDGTPIDAAMLAIIADFVPSASGHALGRQAGANSLDNTIRIRRIVPTEWVCCDIQIHGVHNGFVHGQMNMFSRDGELMATGSQSAILRFWD